MPRALPSRPNLDQLKHKAKDVLKAYRAGAPSACLVLRRLPRLASASPAEIFAAKVTLNDVQFALAQDYGFTNWAELKRFAEAAGPRPQPSLKREGSAVWIEGVPRLGWGLNRDCTYLGALEAALAVTERPWRYPDLMAASGVAFRLRWSESFSASCAVAELPDETRAIEKCTGWDLRGEHQFGQKSRNREPIRERIVRSIDARLPVLAYGSCLDMAVIYGYEDSGRTLWFTDYHKTEMPFRLPLAQLGPMQVYLSRRSEGLPPRMCLVESLRLAVQDRRRGEHDGGLSGRDYIYGSQAYQFWLDSLARLPELPAEEAGQFHYTHHWVWMQLVHARQTAARFLNEQADSTEEAAELLRRAADTCAGLARELHHAGDSEGLFRGSQSGAELTDWASDVRRRESGYISRAMQSDAAVVTDLEKALELLDRRPAD
jgi:hypothetical protein